MPRRNAVRFTLATRLASVLMVAGFLASCASTSSTLKPPVSSVVVVNTTYYPNLPDISVPPKPKIQPVAWDFPRKTTADMIAKNTTACVGKPVTPQNQAQCGIFPVDLKSNIYIGLSQAQWNVLQLNQQELENYYIAASARLAEINKQRAEWRKKNLEQATFAPK